MKLVEKRWLFITEKGMKERLKVLRNTEYLKEGRSVRPVFKPSTNLSQS